MTTPAPSTTFETMRPAYVGLNSAFLLVGSITAALLQWIFLLLIARRGGAVLTGQYSLAQSYVIPASYFAWLSLRQTVIVQRNPDYDFHDYLFLRILVPFLSYSVLFFVISIERPAAEFLSLTAAVFLLKYVEGFFDLTFGCFQASGQTETIVNSSALRFFLSLPAFFIVLTLTNSAPAAIGTAGLVWLAIFVIVEYWRNPLLKRVTHPLITAQPDIWKKRGRLFLINFPLGISGLIMSLGTSIPRIVVDRYLGAAELGYFSAAGHFLVVGSLLTAAVGQALLSELVSDVERKDRRRFWRHLLGASGILVAACGAATPIAFWGGGFILSALYGPSFAAHGGLLVAAAISAAPIFVASVFAFGMFATKKFSAVTKAYAVNLAVMAGLSIWLVPYFGAQGAFAAISFASLVQISIFASYLTRFWLSQSL
jgi:O-antigen/teichoic acid export membrane protein